MLFAKIALCESFRAVFVVGDEVLSLLRLAAVLAQNSHFCTLLLMRLYVFANAFKPAQFEGSALHRLKVALLAVALV